MLPFAPVWLM
jgi:hypothetical protein